MSCTDCDRRQRVALMVRLQEAAEAHGYELWTREFMVRMEVLALPTTPSHGSPAELIDKLKEVGQQTGLPVSPARARAQRAADTKTAQPSRRNDAGHTSYQLDSIPPIELVFLNGQ